jgi:hypothetical protein
MAPDDRQGPSLLVAECPRGDLAGFARNGPTDLDWIRSALDLNSRAWRKDGAGAG